MPALTDTALERAAECLKVLAHPQRLRMAELLLKDRYTVGELAAECGLQSAVASGHLRLLQRCGLLAPERDGKNVYYRSADPCLKKILACIRERFGTEVE